MYPLRFEKKSHKGSKAFTTMLGIKTSSLVWHFRLRHPSSDVVTRVVLNLILIKMLFVVPVNWAKGRNLHSMHPPASLHVP